MFNRFLIGLFALTMVVLPVHAQERFDAPLYAQKGPYAVGTMERIIEDDERPLELSVWYPADADEQLEPVLSRQLVTVAIVRDGDAADQFHDEIRPA